MPIIINRRTLAKLLDELFHAEYYAQRQPGTQPQIAFVVAESLQALGPLPDHIRNFQVTDSNLQQAVALADTLEEPEVYSVTVRFEHDQFPTAHYFIDLTKLTALNDEKYKQAIQLAAANPRRAAVMQGSLAQTGTFGVSAAAKVTPPCAVVSAVTIWARDSHPHR